MRDGERGLGESNCCACGATSTAVDVHFLLRHARGEPACAVVGAAVATWRRRVHGGFQQHGLAPALEASEELHPRARVVLYLGSPRIFPTVVSRFFSTGWPARPAISVQLDPAHDFVATVGQWSALERRRPRTPSVAADPLASIFRPQQPSSTALLPRTSPSPPNSRGSRPPRILAVNLLRRGGSRTWSSCSGRAGRVGRGARRK